MNRADTVTSAKTAQRAPHAAAAASPVAGMPFESLVRGDAIARERPQDPKGAAPGGSARPVHESPRKMISGPSMNRKEAQQGEWQATPRPDDSDDRQDEIVAACGVPPADASQPPDTCYDAAEDAAAAGTAPAEIGKAANRLVPTGAPATELTAGAAQSVPPADDALPETGDHAAGPSADPAAVADALAPAANAASIAGETAASNLTAKLPADREAAAESTANADPSEPSDSTAMLGAFGEGEELSGRLEAAASATDEPKRSTPHDRAAASESAFLESSADARAEGASGEAATGVVMEIKGAAISLPPSDQPHAPPAGAPGSIVAPAARALPHQLSPGEEGGPPAARPVEVDAARFISRVARAFHAAQQRGGELRLRLSPPELGSLRVELRVQDGALTARVEAETTAARSTLLENLPALRERLADQGIRIERFDVDLMQQQGEGARDQRGEWERGRVGEWESRNRLVKTTDASLPLAHSPALPLVDLTTGLNVIV